MNLTETHDLLTFIAAVDNRRFDDATVLAWQPIFTDVPFTDCRAAVLEHFATSDAYLTPVHVKRLAEAAERDRRRRIREQRETEEQLALEADPTRGDRSVGVEALIAELRDRLPDGDPDKLRRSEWIELDRRRQRQLNAEPNPYFTGFPNPNGDERE